MFTVPQQHPEEVKRLTEWHWTEFIRPDNVAELLKRHESNAYNEVDIKLVNQPLCPQITTLHPNTKPQYDLMVVADLNKVQQPHVVEFRCLVLNSEFKNSERYSFATLPVINQDTTSQPPVYRVTVQLKSKYGIENEPAFLFFGCLVVLTPKVELYPGAGFTPYCLWLGAVSHPRGFVAHISNKPVEKKGEDSILHAVLTAYWHWFPPVDLFNKIRLHFRQELTHKKGTRELDDEDISFFKSKVQSVGQLAEETFVDLWKYVYYMERILRKNDGIRKDWNDRRIEGVMSKEQAHEKMKDRPVGTFLFRFSGSTHDMLVVSYTKHVPAKGMVTKHLQIRVQKDKLVVLNGKTIPIGVFPSLAKLAMEKDALQYLYSRDPKIRQTPKHNVFLLKPERQVGDNSDKSESDYDDENF